MRFIYTKTFSRLFAVFVIAALLVILNAAGYLGRIKDGTFRAFGAVAGVASNATTGVKNTFRALFTIRQLVKENAELNQRVAELSFENARLLSSRDENTALRQALSFRQRADLNLISAEVLFSDPTGFSQSIVIDEGSDSGLRPGAAVVAAPGILVGRISKVYPDSAEVTLVTEPSVVVNGEVAESGARGLVRGEHGLGLMFDLVTQNEVIKEGDQVITSGLSGDLPRGLLIGDISALRSSASDLFQKAFISPAADLRNLKFLFVVQ